MRSLFAVAVFLVVGGSPLAAQVAPRPAPSARVTRPPAAQGTGVYLVTFRNGTPASEMTAVVRATGARLRAAYEATNTASVELPDASALARLRNDPRVLSVFEDQKIFLTVQGRGGGGGGGGSKPKAPESVSAVPVSSSQINLAWSDVSNNENGFAIERCTGSGCSNFAEIVRVGPNAASYDDSGLAAQTIYRYRLLAFNAAGSSKYSNIAEATTPAPPPPPPPPPPLAPSNLNAAAITHAQIDLSWSDNSNDETGFLIERCVGSGCVDFTEIPGVGPNVVSHADAGLSAETVYRYRILAFSAAGNSPYSNIAEAMTPAAPPPPPTPPSAPTNLSAVSISENQIDLTWSDNSSDEDGFRIERCIGSGCVDFAEILPVLGANVVSFNNTGLTADTVYRYRIRAFSAAGNSPYSNIAEAMTPAPPPPTPPSAPTNLSAASISEDQIDLTWSDNSGDEDGFRIERCIGSGCVDFAEILPVLGANVVSFNNTGLTAQTVYRYRIQAFSAAGNSSYSNVAEATTLAPPPPPPTPPSAPTGLNAVALTYNHVELNWLDNSADEDGFQIERCTGTIAACASFSQIGQVMAGITAISDFGLQAQTTYTYRVRAFNANGQSDYSNSAQVTTPSAPASTQVIPAGVQRIGAAPGSLNWTGTGVGVAIVDTGLDFAHGDLALQPEVPGVNSFNAFAVGTTCQDIHGHGTHVAGIVGAKNNLIDVVGVAPNSTIYCVNVFQPDPVEGVSATDESVIAGLNWILAHANTVTPRIRVVNMSLGRAKVFGDDNVNHPLRLAVKALYNAGISVVVAAGNDPLTEVKDQVPAFYPEVLAVASTTAEEGVNGYTEEFPACVGLQPIKADSSSYFTTDGRYTNGIGVTISAPGGTREDLFDFTGSCFLEPVGILSTLAGGGTVELSGTSMASPHVAGVIALMWEKELSLGLNLAPEFARTRIRNNAIRRGTAPLDSLLEEYTFDGEREGVIWAPSALLDAPPPPIDAAPTVTIVSPANSTNFPAGTTINFSATATDPEDGNIAASLAWTSDRDGAIGTGATFSRTLTNGNHVITASLVDSGGNTGTASVAISVGASSTPTTMRAASVTYSLQGTTLHYTVKMVNEFGGPVAGASLRVSLYEFIFTGNLWFSNGITDSQGNAHFQLPNVDFGCYTTGVENATAAGLTWIGGTPSNSYCRL